MLLRGPGFRPRQDASGIGREVKYCACPLVSVRVSIGVRWCPFALLLCTDIGRAKQKVLREGP
jgi:hypothetical protein